MHPFKVTLNLSGVRAMLLCSYVYYRNSVLIILTHPLHHVVQNFANFVS